MSTVKAPRDFTYIKPQARRLSEYEALTVHQQPDALDFDRPRGNIDEIEWYLLRADGRPLWSVDSTQLRHADWYAYRDPAQHWQRTYVRHQEQQETAIARASEDAGLNGALGALDDRWVSDVLSTHYRAWSFFEYAIFRALAPAQREALSDTIGNVLCFQSFDHLRHAQDVVIYLVELENYTTAVNDDAGKTAWLESPVYQPARRLAETIMATTDWAELMVGLNLVVGPLLQQLAVSDLVRRGAQSNNDPVAPQIVMTVERDRRRNLAATQAFVRMVVEPSNMNAAHNRSVIQGWIASWAVHAEAVALALAPAFDAIPGRPVDFGEAMSAARAALIRTVGELGFDYAIGASS